MMIFWIMVFLIALAAVAFIGAPLAFGAAANSDVEDDQRSRDDGINRDLEFGLIDESAARDARRDALAALSARQGGEAPAGVARTARVIAFVCLGAAPLGAVLLYLNLGSPQSLGVKAQTVAATGEIATAGGDLAALEARAAAAPADFDAWMALGDAYASADRANESVRAFAKAVSLRPGDANAHAAHGEALVLQADGAVTAEARAAFNEAVRLSPADPRARYYLAEARYQVGALEDAVRGWAALLDDAPAGAPWFSTVAARMKDAAAEGSIALASLGLGDATLQRLADANVDPRAGAATASSFEAAIGRIHDGSAAYEDWIAAASGYVDRDDTERARDILQRAEKRYENAPFVLAQIKTAQQQLAAGQPISIAAAPSTGSPGAVVTPSLDEAAAIAAMPEDDQRRMIEGMVAGLAERLTKEPDNLEGWRMLGRSYRVLGRPGESAKAWRELLRRTDGGPEDWRGLAFALMEQRPQGDDTIDAELQSALEKLLTFNPDDPLALFNLGYAARDRGDKAQALELWKRLQEKIPPDTPLAPTLERLITETQTG